METHTTKNGELGRDRSELPARQFAIVDSKEGGGPESLSARQIVARTGERRVRRHARPIPPW